MKKYIHLLFLFILIGLRPDFINNINNHTKINNTQEKAKDNLSINIIPVNYSWNRNYVWLPTHSDSSNIHTLFNFSNYASSWDEFSKKVSSFVFIEGTIWAGLTVGRIITNPDIISEKITDSKNSSVNFNINYTFNQSNWINLNFHIWHNNTSVLFQWDAQFYSQNAAPGIHINIKKAFF